MRAAERPTTSVVVRRAATTQNANPNVAVTTVVLNSDAAIVRTRWPPVFKPPSPRVLGAGACSNYAVPGVGSPHSQFVTSHTVRYGFSVSSPRYSLATA